MKTTVLVLLLLSSHAARALTRVVQGIPTRIVSLDPFSLNAIDAYQVTGNVLEPLARLGPRSQELIPWLAESWTLNKDKKSFRVKLREGVKFQDGTRLTAEDVKFTFDAFRAPAFKAAVWTPMWEDIRSAQVIDARTVEFTMKDMHYLAFENVLTTLRILPRSFYQAPDAAKFRDKIVGSGPFELTSFHAGKSVEFKPNPHWWGKDHPQFDLLVKTVGDGTLASEMMRKGQLDVYALPMDMELDKAPAKYFKASSAAVGEGLWLDLNLRRPLFQNRTVRRALLILWDRVKANTKLFHGRYHLALDGFSPKMEFYPAGRPESYDEKGAEQLFSGAGWSDIKKEGVLQKDGVPFRFTILVHNAAAERWVSLYQQDAAKAGIKVDIKRVEEDSQWWPLLKDGKFDAVAGYGGVSDTVHASTWRSDGFYNFSGYRNAEVDKLLTRLDSEFDLKSRHKIEGRLIALIRQDHAQVPGLFSPDDYFLLSERVQLDSLFPTQAWRWRLKN